VSQPPQYTKALTEPEITAYPTLPLDRLAVVLVSPRNTLNIGAVARAMSNFGAADLRVAHIFYKDFRSASSAVGPSAELLRGCRDYDTTAEAIHDAHLVVGTTGATNHSWTQPIERLEKGALRIRAALDAGQRVALLFGSEKFGLSSDDVSHCHALMRIPTRDAHPSMNLGQAAALCLYELARVVPATAHSASTPLPILTSTDEPADAETLDRFTERLTEVLLESEFPGLVPGARTRHLRSLVRRLQLSAKDAHTATGFLRQILWKLKQSSRVPDDFSATRREAPAGSTARRPE
jgi:TrmH family RNA methyltransferase